MRVALNMVLYSHIIRLRPKIVSAKPALIANSAIVSTLTTHCHWKDETERDTTGQPPS